MNIDHLYIFLDDFSEIDEEAQKIFMDWFIAPLDNLSDDFVKFKIAVYPHRFYIGRLDNSKIDEILLDFFEDCPKLVELIDRKAFKMFVANSPSLAKKRHTNRIIEIVKYYNSKCSGSN